MLSLRQTWHGALSTARGTKLYHYWRPDDTMFNRTREIAEITKVFLSKPQLSIITGPVNSGKTRFMNEVLSKLPSVTSCPTPILHINLRQGTYTSVRALEESFAAKVPSWMDKISKAAKTVTLSAGPVEIKVEKATEKEKGVEEGALKRFNKLLESVAGSMPERTHLKGIQMPMFVIDEANRLKTLQRDPNGQAALESLFEWFVSHTKENRHFHVVLLSSDSFFNKWVERYVGPSRYELYVLGHLDKTDAETYWNSVVLKNKHEGIVLPTFEDVYKVCGGSIFLLDSFFREFCVHPNAPIRNDIRCFSHVLKERQRYDTL